MTNLPRLSRARARARIDITRSATSTLKPLSVLSLSRPPGETLDSGRLASTMAREREDNVAVVHGLLLCSATHARARACIFFNSVRNSESSILLRPASRLDVQSHGERTMGNEQVCFHHATENMRESRRTCSFPRSFSGSREGLISKKKKK